jgi:hypothetical protein
MANVKANLASNYKSDGSFKDLFFIETLNILTQKKTIEVEIDKSPGFNKQALVKVNSDLKTFPQVSSEILPKNLQIYCNYYTPT